jgi:O-antigen/teichoic acid export membrane protein
MERRGASFVEPPIGKGSDRLFQRLLGWSTLKVFWDVLARAASFLLSLLIARQLGAETFGRYAVLWYLGFLAAQVTDLGLHLVALRHLSQRSGTEPRLVAAAVAAKLTLQLASIAVIATASYLALGARQEMESALLLYAAALAGSWVELAGAVLRSRGRLKLEGAVLMVLRAGWLGGAVVALGTGGGLVEVSRALALGSLPGLVLALGVIGRAARGRASAPARSDVLSFLRQTAPLAVTSLITLVYLRVDVLLLAALRGAEAAGLFAAAFRVIEALFLFSGGIVAGAFPLLAAQAGSGRLADAGGFLLRLLLGLALPAACGLFLLSPGVVGFLFGEGFLGSVAPLRLLSLALVPIYVNALTTHLLVAGGRGRTLAQLMAVRLAVGTGLDLALIPTWGPLGAALAVAAAESSLSLGSLIAVRRVFAPVHLLRAAAAPLAAATVMGLAVSLLPALLPLRVLAGVAVYSASFFLLWKLWGERVLPLRPVEILRG